MPFYLYYAEAKYRYNGCFNYYLFEPKKNGVQKVVVMVTLYITVVDGDYNPWGKPGAGAPLNDNGQTIAKLPKVVYIVNAKFLPLILSYRYGTSLKKKRM